MSRPESFPTVEQLEALAVACENFGKRAKLIPMPKEVERKELARVTFAVDQYRRGCEWQSRGLDSDAFGMAALIFAMAGAAAHACELLDDMLPAEEGWKSGYMKAREMRDQLRAATWPFRQVVPDA